MLEGLEVAEGGVCRGLSRGLLRTFSLKGGRRVGREFWKTGILGC